jgi:predicted Zn finger-like uncharacterized protein
MIAACPKCQTRYRLKPEQLQSAGVRLRCQRCSAIFRVRLPGGVASQAATAPEVGRSAPASEPGPRAPGPAAPRVMLALPASETWKRWVDVLQRWGLNVAIAHDGVEAILTLQRNLPQAVVAHASLPRMSGVELCELMKRNESLRSIPLILIASRTATERLRSQTATEGEGFGADAYLEEEAVAEALRDRLEHLGIRIEAGAPPPPPVSAAATPSEEPSPAPHPGEASDPLADAHVQAERLARIAVSDIVLYNEAKFSAALAGGDVLEAMREEIEEGRRLLRERLPAQLLAQRDYVAEELLRVAHARGAGSSS